MSWRWRWLSLWTLILESTVLEKFVDGRELVADSAKVSVEPLRVDDLQEAKQLERLLASLQQARHRPAVFESRLADLCHSEISQRRLADSSHDNSRLHSSSVPSHYADSSGSGEHGGEHGHQHDALVYLTLALIIGTGLLHLSTVRVFHDLPYTVVLFVLGALCSVFYQAFLKDDPEQFGVFARSYEMWMDIDPHLLIFTMLPVLLCGDAMTLDTAVAKRVASQCLWLAGPGVLMGAFATAFFLWVYFRWDFLLCLASGSILAATDPVAVVGLLKELGASPTLTVQIQGESLLNDGTAMVLFNVAYDMLGGEEHDVKSILIYLLYMIGCSWFVGLIVGGLFSSWIRTAGKRLEHHSDMIQISLTICCAYASFVFAEGIIGISGVLSTVAAALILADTMWIKIVNDTAMHEVWHTLEYMGNTLIFFLAGALSGRSLWLIDAIDVLHLIVIYVVLVIIRATIMFGSRPILQLLSPDHTPVTAADAAVMTWGGLRGAVGLALSITLMRDKAGGKINDAEANKVFFFTAGIAFLTLIINATTCPTLVSRLGIARCPESKNRVLRDLVKRLQEQCEDEAESPAKQDIVRLLDSITHHLIGEQTNVVKSEASKTGSEVVAEFQEAKRLFELVPDLDKNKLGWSGKDPLLGQEERLLELALSETADSSMVRTISESFLAMVRHNLWNQIQLGMFVEGTRSPEILLGSNSKAAHRASCGLTDYQEVARQLGVGVSSLENRDRLTRQAELSLGDARISTAATTEICSSQSRMSVLRKSSTHMEDLGPTWQRTASRLMNSVYFQGFIVCVIVGNAFVIFFDEGAESDNSMTFLVLECLFLAIYGFEFVVKFIVLGRAYFKDGWNALDFMCLLLGLFGVITAILVEVNVLSSVAISSEMMLVRLGRVFKLMRVVRLISLLKFLRTVKARIRKDKVSPELATVLEVIFTLRGFVRAHLQSHWKFLKYYGAQTQRCVCGNKFMSDAAFCRKCGTKRPENMPAGVCAFITGCEQARCILESCTAIFNAVVLGSLEIERVESHGEWILDGLNILRASSAIASRFSDFVLTASADCVILSKDAETLIHPIYEHLRKTNRLFADTHEGIHTEELKQKWDEHRQTSGHNGFFVQISPDAPGISLSLGKDNQLHTERENEDDETRASCDSALSDAGATELSSTSV